MKTKNEEQKKEKENLKTKQFKHQILLKRK